MRRPLSKQLTSRIGGAYLHAPSDGAKYKGTFSSFTFRSCNVAFMSARRIAVLKRLVTDGLACGLGE